MVYCGKPSRGCQNCKTRRIKCDETKPHCNNCRRTRRECPGYPAEFDLIFRRETPNAQKRVRKTSPVPDVDDNVGDSKTYAHPNRRHIRSHALKRYPRYDDTASITTTRDATTSRKRRRKDLADSALIRHDSAHSSLTTTHRNENNITGSDLYTRGTFLPSIDEQATTFFFRNFLLPTKTNDSSPSQGLLEVAAPMVESTGADSPVSLALKAVAIGIVANWPGRENLAPLGARYYGRALCKIQKAIEDPTESTSDATLLSILLFSLYESVISNDHSPAAWSQHIEGAIAVVRARGIKQLQNPLSLLLFRAARTQMLTHAIQSQQDIPDFPGVNGWLSDIDGNDQVSGRSMVECAVRLPRLLGRAKRIRTYHNTDPKCVAEVEDLLREAKEVEQSLDEWEKHIPAHWTYRPTSPISSMNALDPDEIEELNAWPGPMHIYEDAHVSSVRNNHRVNHMLCSNIVIECVKWLNPEHYHQNETYRRSSTRICELVDEVCYSVPFHLWGANAGDKSELSMLSHAGAEAIGGYFLIWPLYTASTMQVIPPLQRRWLQARLWTISRHYGIDKNTITSPPPATNDLCGHQTDQSRPSSTATTTSSSSSGSISTAAVGSSTSSPFPDNPAPAISDSIINNNLNNDNNKKPRDLTTLQGTKSIRTFVHATDLLLQMTRTMDIGPRVFIAGPAEVPSSEEYLPGNSGEHVSLGHDGSSSGGLVGGAVDSGVASFVADAAVAVTAAASVASVATVASVASSVPSLPQSGWQNGMWASLRTMLELAGVRTG